MKKSSLYAWYIFFAASLISLIGFSLCYNTLGLFFQPISMTFKISRTSVALMSTFSGLAGACTGLIAGKVMKKFNLRWLLTLAFAIIGLGFISLNFAQSIFQFYIVFALVGICATFGIALSIPILLGNWFKKGLGTVMGVALSISAFGSTLFQPIIGNIITNSGWRVAWLVEGAILLLLVPVCFFIKEKPGKNQKAFGEDEVSKSSVHKSNDETGMTLKEALHSPIFYILIVGFICLYNVCNFIQHVSGHVVNIGLPLTVGAEVVSMIMLGAFFGKISIGFLFDKFKNQLVVLLYGIVGLIGWIGMFTQKTATMLLISGFICGLGQGLIMVGGPYLVRKVFGSKDYGNILAIVNTIGGFWGAIAVSLDGMLFDLTKSYNLPIMINIIGYIVATITIIISLDLAFKYAHTHHIVGA
ncbi:MFS transporter [Lactobacillus mulieris]|uniref:MFS transporter n=1 Tax=Lactobacillus mulieris TaxID=2508708 RepID=UPI001433149C|nr:MFS transporter [Lactobacillus mulieris]MCF1783655.1 MFS transporter [Lactobacillus mulieris]MCW8104257.1 MFS transporter [Lactobacillus mulieris]MDK6803118.1 MFS transporter [Lactobacillus mulieris]MDK8382234.1 MFS transporter [Lactobacillus mulieris]MDT9620376.1 MFS transporter [Lactobacillus mulieris]